MDPARSKKVRSPGEVWSLTLDQIKSNSGRVIEKERVDSSELGSSTYAFDAGVVLYSKLRPYLNKVVVADEPGYATTELVPLLCNPARLNHRYLAYFLRSPKFLDFATAAVAGAKMPRMVMNEFWSYPVPVPPLKEQRRIAAILDQVDAVRDKRREALAQLDSLAESIFEQKFGDPATPREICVSAHVGDCVAEMQYGPRFYNEGYSGDGLRIVRITDLDAAGELNFDAMPRMDVDEATRAQFCLHPGDIVFARTGATVGKVSLIREGSPPCIAGAYFIRLRFKQIVTPEYAYAVLRTKSLQTVIAKQSRQAAQQNFSGPGLRRLPMPVPPMQLQQEFSDCLAAIRSAKHTQLESLFQMNRLFDSIQHRAFSGTL